MFRSLRFSVLRGQDDKSLEESIGGEIEGQARHVRLDLAPVALARDQIVPSDILDGHFSAFLLFEKPVRAMATAIGLGGTDAQERGERGEQRESPGVVRAQGGAAEPAKARLLSLPGASRPRAPSPPPLRDGPTGAAPHYGGSRAAACCRWDP